MTDEQTIVPAVIKPTKKNTYFLNFFAWWIVTLIFTYAGLITFLKIPEGNKDYVTFILGSMFGAALSQVVNWAFRTAKAALEQKHADAQLKQMTVNE